MSWQPIGLVGHRGASVAAPENTMAAFLAARSLGADAIEFDVHHSVDGELVVIHNYTVDRTTDGTGAVSDLTWGELSSLDAGSWFGPGFAGEPIPRLEQVLDLDDVDFELELKGFGSPMLDGVVAAVDDAGVLDRVKFTSGTIPLVAELKRRRPEATVGLFSPPRQPWMSDDVFERLVVGTAEFTAVDHVHVDPRWLTPTIVERLHLQGRMVQAAVATTPDEVHRAVAAGADHIAANDVAMARRALAGC